MLDDVAALVAERNRLDAALARAVRAAEVSQAPERDGLRSMASWLRGHCRLSGSEALRVVTAGRALAHLPVLAEAAEAGLVSAAQVAEAVRLVTPQRLAAFAAAGVDLGEVDGVLTGVAVEAHHAALVQVVQTYLAALDPDGPEPDRGPVVDAVEALRRQPLAARAPRRRRRGEAAGSGGGPRAG